MSAGLSCDTAGEANQTVIATANAKTNSSHQATIMSYLSNQRESVSGVSIDEEMILLTQYQMGYAAAGKLSSSVNEMLDILMSIVE